MTVIDQKVLSSRQGRFDQASYQKAYKQSIEEPDLFWTTQAARIDWFAPFKKVSETSFKSPVSIAWYLDGKLNAAYNCLDRHLEKHGDRVAILWEPDDPKGAKRRLTYRELYEQTCRMAEVFRSAGIQKGDRVTIYLPMIPEAVMAMLACARIGAIHSVVFGGFSSDSIADRILDCESDYVVTADTGRRGGKVVPLKENVDRALERASRVKKVFVVEHTSASIQMQTGRDVWLLKEMQKVSHKSACETMDSEDPLFLLYTSGSTNKPKGVLHTTGGYLVYAALTFETIFDYRENEVFWCTADVGWITGHSYVVYGPLLNAATVLMFEGIPTYPEPDRSWKLIDDYRVNIFYTAPTAIRTLMRFGDAPFATSSRDSLRLLGTVGEPINPEAWLWYFDKVGKSRCPIVDTWWQTETGGIMISSIPSVNVLKPGAAAIPFFGVKPSVVDAEGVVLEGACEGNLCLEASWPGQMRTVYRDHARFEQTYFKTYKGKYFTGDGCRRDQDGDYWITGRVDDVLNVSGHRLGTAEIESALVSHASVAEAAVVGVPHEIKGQGIYAFVTLKLGVNESEALRLELIQWVRGQIGPIASPDQIQWAPALPKTRSGKIMRRILRKIAEGSFDQLGDTTTLADTGVVLDLIKNQKTLSNQNLIRS